VLTYVVLLIILLDFFFLMSKYLTWCQTLVSKKNLFLISWV